MSTQRSALPKETNRLFLTDGGTETWLMYKRGVGHGMDLKAWGEV